MGNRKEDEIIFEETLHTESAEQRGLNSREVALSYFHDNKNLIYFVTHKFSEPRDPAISKEDIEQEAAIGLWRASLMYDPDRGTAFSTYAVPMMRSTILIFLRNNEVLKTPRSYKDIRSALARHGFTLPLTKEEVDILLKEGRFSQKQLADYVEISYVSLDYTILYLAKMVIVC